MLIPIDPEIYDAITDDSFDDFVSKSRRRPFSHYRRKAFRYKGRKFPAPTRGKAPVSIFIDPKRLDELRQQRSSKKKSTPDKKSKKSIQKTTPKPPSKKQAAAPKMVAAKKAMGSDRRAAKPAKIIAIVVAIAGTSIFGYLVWKQYKKQIV